MLLQKIWLSFLCASMWTHTQPLRNTHICKTNAHAHPSTLSLSLMNTITVIYTQKKKNVWLCSFTLWQETLRQSQGKRETQLLFPALNLQLLPMKREPVQFDSIVSRQHGYPDSGTPNTSSAVDAAQISHVTHTGAATQI